VFIFALYQFYLSGGVPRLVRQLTGKQTVDVRTITGGPRIEKRLPDKPDADPQGVSKQCPLKIETDPPGARVWMNGKEKGVSSTSVSGGCGDTVTLGLQLDGYETISEKVTLQENAGVVSRTLTKIPLGTLEVTPSRNVQIYIDGKLYQDAPANRKVEMVLRANQKHTVRYINQIQSIDTTREYFIEPDTINRDILSFESKSSGKKPKPKW
jgi:hypothetical protein